MFPAGIDTAPCARLLAAFHSDRWSGQRDRARAAALEEIAPGCGDLIRDARAWHQRAARWSLGLGCGGGIVCGAGYPAAPETHRSASGRLLHGRWVLCDPDAGVTVANRWGPGQDPSGQVSAIQGSAVDPGDILGRAEVRALTPPLSAHSQMGAQFWADGQAADAVAGWGRLLPPGSVFCLSLWLADLSTPEGREFTAAFGEHVQPHGESDVRRWFREAGGLRVEEPLRVRRCAAGAVATVAARVV